MFYKAKVNTKVEEYNREYKISITEHPNFIGSLFGINIKTTEYFGDCTVWYKSTPDGMKRAGTLSEGWLADILSTYKRSK